MSILQGDSAKALEAVISGNSVDTVVDRDSDPEAHGVTIEEDDGFGNTQPEKIDSALDAHLQGLGLDADEETQEDDLSQPDSEESAGQQEQTSGDIEKLVVTDDKGRREIEIDYSDKDKIKKYVRMAHGMRKFQAERDQVKDTLSSTKEELTKVQGNWNALEGAYKSNGIQGLIELLDGPEAYSKFEQSVLDRNELRRNASPEELEVLDSRDRESRYQKELEAIRRENESFKQKVESEREEMEVRALESRIHPVFGKYRFAGKLGSADDEHMFDDMLWSSAMKKLEPLEEQGIEITPEAVDKAFSSVSTAIRKRIRANADKRVSQTVARKKEQAAASAEKTVMRGVQNNSSASEARDLLKQGNLSGLLRGWGKYGDLFNK